MDPISIGLLAGQVAAPILGGLAGQLFGEEDRARARELLRQSVADWDALDPTVQAQLIDETLANTAPEDPVLREAQMGALAQMARTAREGGLAVEDRAKALEAQRQTAQVERGAREALSQNFQARGAGGSGLELAEQLAAQQGAADRNSAYGMGVAADASRRALEAAARSGSMAGAVREQDFQVADAKRRAKMTIAQFNAQMRQGAQQQTFNNRARRVEGRADARGGLVRDHQGRADYASQVGVGVGGAVSDGLGTAYRSRREDEFWGGKR